MLRVGQLRVGTTQIGSRLRVFLLAALPGIVLMSVSSIKTGWTFYPPLVFILEAQTKSCLV